MRRARVHRANVQAGEALPPAECARCHSNRTLLAYEHDWSQCHVCQACHHVWDVDKTPPCGSYGNSWRWTRSANPGRDGLTVALVLLAGHYLNLKGSLS
jgi:hypothetical protein